MSFPVYLSYKDSGVSWLGEVPSHWEVMPLKRRYSVTLGKMLQPDARSDTDVERSYLRAANIKWGQVDLADVKTMWFSAAETAALTLRDGDLLVSEGGDVGRSAIWRGELAECHFQNSVNRVRPISDASTKFLFYWMATIKAKGYVDVLCNKSTIAHFTAEKVEAVPMPIPPASEQEAIAAFLDRETAKIDALVTEQERLIVLLKEKRQAVISHTVTKGLNPHAAMRDSGFEWLGDLPAHWDLLPLKRHWSITDCKHVTAEFVDDGFPLASIREVQSKLVQLDDAKCTTEEFFNLLREGNRDPQPGDLIFSRNATVGEVAQVTCQHPPFAMGQDVCLVRKLDPSSSTGFIQHVLRSSVGKVQMDHAMIGSTFKRINVEEIRSLLIPLPPPSEQADITAFAERVHQKADTLIDEAQSAITLLQERRAALISAAVTGKIDVRGLVDQHELEAA